MESISKTIIESKYEHMVKNMMGKCDFFELFTNKRKVFFLGIGGISMSAVAMMAKKGGCEVAGYDQTLSHLTEKLIQNGIPVTDRFDEKNYENVSLIVYTGAIHDTDPNLAYPRKIGIPEMTRAEFLGLLMKQSENPIGISGTHGKSSTTGMLSSVFLADGTRDPSIMVGAELSLLDGTYRIGGGEDFIFEACEYQDSFLHFFPRIALVLNVEHDHADYFPDLEAVIRSFTKFCDLAQGGFAVINADNEGAVEVARRTKAKIFSFSLTKKSADVHCENLREEKGRYSFDIFVQDTLYASVSLRVPGLHNVSNALAAAAASYLSGISGEAVKKGLECFGGVKRRFELRGKCHDFEVVDDYAHHPDEIRATLSSAKKLGYSSVTVVFQSHTFTRTKAYFDDFVSALEEADEVIYADIYPAREEPIPGIDAKALAKKTKGGKYVGDFQDIAEYLLKKEGNGLIIIMGAGNVIEITDKILTERE